MPDSATTPGADDSANPTVSSETTAGAFVPSEYVEDDPGEGYGPPEFVPGLDYAGLLDETSEDESASGEWAGFTHLDDERETRSRRRDDRPFAERFADSFGGRTPPGRPPSVASAPWRWICQLVVTNANGTQSLGTGWLASPRLVVTTGRCINDHGHWAREIEVIAGLDGSYRPYDSKVSKSFRTHKAWVDSQDPAYDYGCIILPANAFPSIGHFGQLLHPGAGLRGQVLHTAGYPKEPRGIQQCALWRASRDDLSWSYGFEVDGAAAGSPVWLRMDRRDRSQPGQPVRSQRLVCGMFGSGAGPDRMIRKEVFDLIKSWRELVKGTNGAQGTG